MVIFLIANYGLQPYSSSGTSLDCVEINASQRGLTIRSSGISGEVKGSERQVELKDA